MPDNNSTPLNNRLALEQEFSNYEPLGAPAPLPNVAYTSLDMRNPRVYSGLSDQELSPLTALENSLLRKNSDGRIMGGGIDRSLSEVSSNRFSNLFLETITMRMLMLKVRDGVRK